MSTISRKLPASNLKRRLALSDAATKLANPGPNGIIITGPTQSRLNIIHPQYVGASNAVNQKKAYSIAATAQKNEKLSVLKLLVKHFVGVFNYGIERGKYAAAERAFFGIDENDSNLPDLSTEAAVKTLAEQITDNDAARVATGGQAMANPSTAEVLAALTAYNTEAASASAIYETYDIVQEALNALNTEADGVIKKVWDEVETFYNEETVESMRANAREWGVQYISVGETSTITLTVVDSAVPPQPVVLATITLLDTGVQKTTDLAGKATFETSVFGPAIDFLIESDVHPDKTVTLSYEQGENVDEAVQLE